jgi:biotin carboxyl carrier protein
MGKVLASDASGRKLRVEVEGHIFDIEIRDPLDQMLEQMGFSAARNKRVAEIKAPMPGLVLKTYVSEGQAAKQGDPILVLEAMKMENSIALNTDAKIKRLLVKDGQIVEKGQVLVELE